MQQCRRILAYTKYYFLLSENVSVLKYKIGTTMFYMLPGQNIAGLLFVFLYNLLECLHFFQHVLNMYKLGKIFIFIRKQEV